MLKAGERLIPSIVINLNTNNILLKSIIISYKGRISTQTERAIKCST